jgi:ubiquinone/menaquinone biosynthesis C-methylase UbiE
MHERRYNRAVERLRDPERVARMEVERVVSLVLEGLEGVGTALDIGTGSGLFAEQFAMRGLDVAGVDANPDMLRAAQGFVPGGSFREAPAEQLPYLAGSFDLAFMGLVLHETDDTLLALREACRVTTRRVAVLEWPPEEQPVGPPMAERLPAEKVQELALAAGFRAVEVIRLTVLVLYLLEK